MFGSSKPRISKTVTGVKLATGCGHGEGLVELNYEEVKELKLSGV